MWNDCIFDLCCLFSSKNIVTKQNKIILCLFLKNQLLDCVPDPNQNDIALRSERKPLQASDRNNFFKKYGFGVMLVTLVYSMLAVLRNFRDYFAPEIFKELLGDGFDPSTFSATEVPIGVVTTIIFASLIVVKNDRKAFFLLLAIMITGW